MSTDKGEKIGLAFIILSLDQLTKFLVLGNLRLNQPYAVIKGVFYLTLVHNRGAAFGILKNQVPVFIFTSIAAVVLICLNLRRIHRKTLAGKDGLSGIALALILGGALGNLIDRLFFGYVIDFLDFRVWPVFNLADSAITVGAILLGWSILRNSKSQIPNYK